MFGKAEADVTATERSIAKMINFGIVYGLTPIGLFNRLRPQGVDVTLEQCEQFVADYFRKYAGVKRFLNQVETRSRERGYVLSLLKRRRRVSGRTPREIRQAQNFVIQGTAADIAKDALVRLHAALPEEAVRHVEEGEENINVISVCPECTLPRRTIVVEHVENWRSFRDSEASATQENED
jgi:DNA polymerase I